MYCIAASVAILLITWEAVLVSGSTCPSACCQMIKSLRERIEAVEAAGPSTSANEWQLVFSAKNGTGLNVLEAWKTANDSNPEDTDADIFRSPLVDQWGERSIDQVRIELKVGNDVKAYFEFNGRGTTKMSFMSEDTLMASSNVIPKGQTRRSSFQVDRKLETSDRSFVINGMGSARNCNENNGWTRVIEEATSPIIPGCSYGTRAQKPFFLYCEGEGPCLFKDAPIADTFRILLKFD